MQLPYDNASGQFFAFLKKNQFSPIFAIFSQKKHSFFQFLTICRTSMKFCMQLPYGNASGQFFAFMKKIDFRRFFIENIVFLVPHNSKTICRASTKFGMQLSYGNASGQLFAFLKKIDFPRFQPFFIEKDSFLQFLITQQLFVIPQ